ncbi:type III secretion system protein [Candidatus Hamiltonella defensa]|uniref:Type III secretion system protein n=1 Tax=Candidatus Williamhamiltonella defendens TaxID=138072 RepID=A0A2D3T5T3_9ENTR|nr:type III secretion system protein [Candidatus Hamiltonella defensa]ASV32894.1 type III secretion system protein [Candidatus Hamiltonella defensa]ATW31074.1 type III secretion system protein [Candidatus Hamiltonella defensa]ATW33033.1 type III secretion system protein [Candidatus Hamiltonella defensa]AWK15850.1 type III secretion system protein [Candidatus Hamiltonella defensa]AYB49123.1 type III secretion system protein [Candidatus Hamiltonella defensa]
MNMQVMPDLVNLVNENKAFYAENSDKTIPAKGATEGIQKLTKNQMGRLENILKQLIHSVEHEPVDVGNKLQELLTLAKENISNKDDFKKYINDFKQFINQHKEAKANKEAKAKAKADANIKLVALAVEHFLKEVDPKRINKNMLLFEKQLHEIALSGHLSEIQHKEIREQARKLHNKHISPTRNKRSVFNEPDLSDDSDDNPQDFNHKDISSIPIRNKRSISNEPAPGPDPYDNPNDVEGRTLLSMLSSALHDPNISMWMLMILLSMCEYNASASGALHIAENQKKALERQQAAQELSNRVNELVDEIPPSDATKKEDFTKELIEKAEALGLQVDGKNIVEYLKNQTSDGKGGYQISRDCLDAIKGASDQIVSVATQVSSEAQIKVSQQNNTASNWMNLAKTMVSALGQLCRTIMSS